MATIRKRGDRYHCMVRKAHHPTLTRSFRTKAEAKAWATEQENKINKGTVIRREDHTLAVAIERYRSDPDRTLKTNQKTILKWWETEARSDSGAILGNVPVTKLRRSDFKAAQTQLRALKRHGRKLTEACLADECDCPRLAPATVQRRMDSISAVLTEAMKEWEWIDSNPARVKRVKEDNERDRLLSDAEVERLLKACRESEEPCLYAFVVTAMASGCRAGELQALRWQDLDLEKGVARVLQSKNGQRRPAPIAAAVDALRESTNVVSLHGDDHVFRSKAGSSPFHYRWPWHHAKVAAGIPDVHFHDLRHWAASHLAMTGVSQGELMAVLGHKTAAMTKRYSHYFDSHIADLGDRLSARLFSKAGE